MTILLPVLTTACVEGDAPPADEPGAPEQLSWRDRTYDRADLVPLPAPSDVTSLAGKSRAELADLLRVKLAHPNGATYTMAEPNWEAADAVLAPELAIDRVPVGDAEARARRAASTPGNPAAVERPSVVTDDALPVVIGSDGRTLSPTTTHPFSSIARVRVFTGNGFAHRIDCTGSFIGQWTFVLAGHCMAFPNGSGGLTLATRIVVEPGRAGSTFPFPTADCSNADAATGNDFLFGVPAGYNGTVDSALNFAVIDMFPCVSAGVPSTRRFDGYSVNTGTTTYNMHGYPLGRCPGASAESTFMCGMSDGGYVNEHRLESQLDGEVGQDGAPWWTISPTRVAGVHLGYREYFDFGRCGFDNCRRQYARRIDNAMDTFIRSVAFDF